MSNLEKLDRIHISEEGYKKITEWANENRDNYDEKDIPIFEGVMALEKEFMGHNIVGLLHFKFSEEGMYLCTYDGQDNSKVASTLIGGEIDPNNLNIKIHDERLDKPKLRPMVQQDLVRQFILLMDVFLYMQFHREYVQAEKQSRKVKKAGGKSGKSTNRVTRLSRTIYSFDYTKEGVDKRRYERHTESWNQKGFWRHYKSGKIVWIEPMVKGSGKNVEPKTYRD